MNELMQLSKHLSLTPEELVGQSMALFNLLRSKSGGWTFDELVAESKLSEGLVIFALDLFVKSNAFRFDARDCRYRLGSRLLDDMYRAMSANELLTVSVSEIYGLRDKIGETVFFVVDDGAHAMVMSRALSGREVISTFEQLGLVLGFHNSASGKAILAEMEPIRRLQTVHSELEQVTDKTIVSAEALIEDLEQTRERGYAINDEESEAGLRGVAAAVYNANGEPIASVSVAGPSFRLKYSRLEAIADEVIATARRITEKLQKTDLTPINPQDPIRLSSEVCDAPDSPNWLEKKGKFLWLDPKKSTLLQGLEANSGKECCQLTPVINSYIKVSTGEQIGVSKNVVMNLSTGKKMEVERDIEVAVPSEEGGLWALMNAEHHKSLVHISASGMVTDRARLPTSSQRLAYCWTYKRVYASSPEQGVIHAYDLVSNRLLQIAQYPASLGQPSAMSMDPDCNLWVAFNDGWSLFQLSPYGVVLRKLYLPVPIVTGLCFGGESGRDLLVTSQRSGLSQVEAENAPLAGHAFVYKDLC